MSMPPSWIHTLLLLLATAVSVAAPRLLPTQSGSTLDRPARTAFSPHAAEASPRVSVTDATGVAVPARAYRRIVSASTVADRVLLDLYDREKIVAITAFSMDHDPDRHRMAGLASLSRLDDLEALHTLKPDLVLVNGYGDPSRVARVRESGIAVFDLGRDQGVRALLDDIGTLGQLLRMGDAARRYADRLLLRLQRVAAPVPIGERLQTLYVSPIGDRLYGATISSSQHDILTFAGLIDVAADTHRGFPEYTAEDLLLVNPDTLVTKRGMGARFCQRPGLSMLTVCRQPGRIFEIDEALLDSGGPTMLDAAEDLHQLVYHATAPR